MAIEDDDGAQATVSGPSIQATVVLKFFLFSALMVATPTAVFFLSYHRHFDRAHPSQAWHSGCHAFRP